MSFQDPTVYPLKSCQIQQMSKFQRKKLFNMHITGILWRTAEWVIRAPEQYYTQGWKQIFKHIKSAKVKRLVLDLNQRPTILKHIVHIKFTQLKELWLHGNFIDSVQPVAFLNTQKLVCLSISENKISDANCLSKAKFPQLTHIYLEKNKFEKFNKIERCTFKKIFEFALDWQKKDPVVIEDLSVLCRIQMQKKGVIRIQSRSRINQDKVYKKLGQKFDQCSILISEDIRRR